MASLVHTGQLLPDELVELPVLEPVLLLVLLPVLPPVFPLLVFDPLDVAVEVDPVPRDAWLLQPFAKDTPTRRLYAPANVILEASFADMSAPPPPPRYSQPSLPKQAVGFAAALELLPKGD